MASKKPKIEPIIYQSQVKAFEWIKDQGYKLSLAKFYRDQKKGRIKLERDGSVRHESVMDYILAEGLDKSARTLTSDYGDLSLQKQRKEVEKLNAQVEKLNFDLDRERGKYLLKEEVRTELALKIAAFESSMKHLIHTNAIEWIKAVKGDSKKLSVWVEMFTKKLDEMLDEMGQCEELNIEIKRSNATD